MVATLRSFAGSVRRTLWRPFWSHTADVSRPYVMGAARRSAHYKALRSATPWKPSSHSTI